MSNDMYIKFNDRGQLLDETGKTLWQELNRGYDASDTPFMGHTTMPVMRYKPPYTRIATFDMKADAIQLVVESIMNIDLPYYVAYVVGVDMINKLRSELEVEFVEFDENAKVEDYIVENVAGWIKKISDMVPTYCKRYIRGEIDIQGNSIPAKQLFGLDRTSAWYQIQCSCYSSRGKRKTQEDRYICLPSIDVHTPGVKPDIPLFAVFDGHNGPHIAAYAAAHLPFEFGAALKANPDVAVSLSKAMSKLDKRITARCDVEPWRSVGATAVVAAITPNAIHLRWLGDSSAFILHPNEMSQHTVFHNADSQAEVDRVNASGGEFTFREGELRVQGVLSVSRALGDISLRPALSGDPEEIVIPRSKDQYILMLVCDGITDVFKPADLYDQVETYVQENDPDEYAEMAEQIVSAAIERGSADNCTCVIAFLRPPKDLWKLLEPDCSDSD